MNARKLLAVSAFLHDLAAEMIAAVALECGECSCCGDCLGENDEVCECDYCPSRKHCRGIELPDCLLEQAGIGPDQGWEVDTEDGIISIRPLPDEDCDAGDSSDQDDNPFPEEVPDVARQVFLENDICINRLRVLLCDGEPISF